MNTSQDGRDKNKGCRRIKLVVIRIGIRFEITCNQLMEKVNAAHGNLVGLAKTSKWMVYANLRSLYIGALEPMILRL